MKKKNQTRTNPGDSQKTSESIDLTEDRIIRFTVYGNLPGVNDIYRGHRTSHQQKKNTLEGIIAIDIKHQLRGVKLRKKFAMQFKWYHQNTRKDQDNVEFGKKFIMDAAQKAGLIENDNWKWAGGNTIHEHYVDPLQPRCEVAFIEGLRITLDFE